MKNFFCHQSIHCRMRRLYPK